MKLFTAKKISELDKFTIENEPVSAINLMERAAMQVTNWLEKKFKTDRKIIVFAGYGNNGGDALAVARQLTELGYKCEVYMTDFGKALADSTAINHERLVKQGKVTPKTITPNDGFPEIRHNDIVIDGLFGTGLTRPLGGSPAAIVRRINRGEHTIVSIDMPSGLFPEDNNGNIPENIIQADYTLTFQFPKISFLLAENEIFTGKWEVLPIGLHPKGLWQIHSKIFLADKGTIQKIINPRPKFAHKGTFGHALLIAGSYGKMGAAVLASKACMRAGAGLLTAHVPSCGCQVIQTAVPEAMVSADGGDHVLAGIPEPGIFSAIGIGPGIGTKHETVGLLQNLLQNAHKPLVIDADGLNIIAENEQLLEMIPRNTILTPHVGEFSRLVGKYTNSYERIQAQRLFAKQYRVIVVLKGAHTTIATPGGKLYFNSTGNPGMATAGSGDVLTGIILGLLAQGIAPEDAAKAGVFIHGLAGDKAVSTRTEHALIASDIIDFMPTAFNAIKYLIP